MREITLDALLAGRPSLRPGEVVTIVVSVAGELAAMHAAEQVHGAVSPAAIVLEPASRPRLRAPADPPAEVAGESAQADVRALAGLAEQLLGPFPPRQLVCVLRAAAADAWSPQALAVKTLAACRPVPVRCTVPGPRAELEAVAVGAPFRRVPGSRSVPRRAGAPSSRRGGVLALALVPLVGIVVAAVWLESARSDGRQRPGPVASATPRQGERGTPSAAASTPTAAATGGPSWRTVLETLDRRRASAYARGDAAALRRVYVPGSAALGTDAATLRAYRSAGLRVHGMRLRVGALHEVSASRSAAVLRVTDRLEPYRIVGVGAGGRGRRGPGRGDVTWRVTLRHVDGGWRIASVHRRR